MAVMAVALAELEEDEPRSCKRTCWVRPYISRKDLGVQNLLLKEVLQNNPEEYRRLLRVSHDQFQELLSRVGPRIARQNTGMRRSIDPATRLQVTLRYLATGESHHSLSRQFRLGHSSVNNIIHETCAEIYDELKGECLRLPKTDEEWREVMTAFEKNWNFPNCVGAVDGKHVCITKPKKSGSIYINYKKTFSIILMAVVDASYKFLYIDVGAAGSEGDAGVWQTTPLRDAILKSKAGLPGQVKVASAPDLLLPPVLVGDDAFPIGNNLMKPYGGATLTQEQRIFNYRLSRARRVVENAFGILSNRFRCLLSTINAQPERVTKIVTAACVLHNFLSCDLLCTPEARLEDGALFGLTASRGRSNAVGASVREKMCTFFNNRGAVSWQNDSAHVDIQKHRVRPRKTQD